MITKYKHNHSHLQEILYNQIKNRLKILSILCCFVISYCPINYNYIYSHYITKLMMHPNKLQRIAPRALLAALLITIAVGLPSKYETLEMQKEKLD